MYATCNVIGNMGRLGNQLFQAATTISYALDHGKQYIFPRWDYQDYIKLPIANKSHEVIYTQLSEHSLRYTEFPFVEGNVNLHGHFLSTKYFQHNKKKIRDIFYPGYWDGDKHETLSPFTVIHRENSCSIHVRRGDYTNPEQMEAHGLLGMDYYNKAIDMVLAEQPDTQFMIFSDDIKWCMENFKINAFFIHQSDIEDLLTMSTCNRHIISNSTFGWWAAWLSFTNKQTIAPRQWFKHTQGWDDLYEPNWTVI